MANYDIPQYPTKRLRYFNNQFLKDQDFIDVDAARIGHERAVLRSLCVAGVCEGLVITYPAPNKPPSVSAGVAVDKTGRMIVIDQPTDGLADPSALADGDYFVHISFLESEDDKATGQGAPDYTRWKQTPAINATAKSAALPDGAVVLGSCTVQNKAFVGSGTTIGRQYSGLRLPGPNQGAAATLRNNGASDDLSMLTGSLTVRRDMPGQIGPTLTLLNAPGGTGAGGAIDFNGSDPGTNDPALRVRSLDDGNSSSHLTFSTKQPGAQINQLVERLRLTSNGLLQFSNDFPKDKLVIYDNGATNRYGIGLNDSNINLFYPANAHFSLRQNSISGTEVFKVDASGTATFSGALTLAKQVIMLGTTDGSIAAANEVVGGIGFLGTSQSHGQLSYRTSQGFELIDCSIGGPHVGYSTTDYPYANLTLGLLKFSNDVPKDKIIIFDNGTRRLGMGLNAGNINLFCPPDDHFSLRQNSSSGTEVYTIDGNGNGWTRGRMTFQQPDGNSRISMYNEAGSGRLVIYNASYNGVYLVIGQGWINYSDVALKTDIVAHEPVLDRVMKLRPVRFSWKADGSGGSGFIAQEVETLFPDLVSEGSVDEATGRCMKGMSYERFGVLAIAAIKELKMDHDARLDALERRLATREGKS